MRNKRGFTVMELIIAISIMLLLGVAGLVFLVNYLDKSRVASVIEDVKNVNVALRSALVKFQDNLPDENGDGDYLPDLIRGGYLDRMPSSISDATWRLEKVALGNGKFRYYINVNCSSDDCKQLILKVDSREDANDGSASGIVQWN